MLNHKIKTTPRLHSALDFFAEAANDVQGRTNVAGADDGMDAGGRATQGAVAGCAGATHANGNLTQRTDNLLSTRFAYDNLERLDTALGLFGSRDYSLDKNGNRTQLQSGATTTTYSYRPARSRGQSN